MRPLTLAASAGSAMTWRPVPPSQSMEGWDADRARQQAPLQQIEMVLAHRRMQPDHVTWPARTGPGPEIERILIAVQQPCCGCRRRSRSYRRACITFLGAASSAPDKAAVEAMPWPAAAVHAERTLLRASELPSEVAGRTAESQQCADDRRGGSRSPPTLTNPLIFVDPGIGTIRPGFVDASAEDGLERRYEGSGWVERAF